MFARLPTIGHAETEASFNLPRVQKRTREKEREKFLGQIFSKYFDLFYPMDHCFSFFFFFFSRGAFNRDVFISCKKDGVKDDAREKFFFLLFKILKFYFFFLNYDRDCCALTLELTSYFFFFI